MQSRRQSDWTGVVGELDNHNDNLSLEAHLKVCELVGEINQGWSSLRDQVNHEVKAQNSCSATLMQANSTDFDHKMLTNISICLEFG